MNILVLESDLRHIGGSEVMAFAAAKGLAERGHNLYLVHAEDGMLVRRNEKAFREIEKQDLPFFSWRDLVGSLGGIGRLEHFVKQWNIDVIFTSHLGYLRTLAMLQMKMGVPFVYHLGLVVTNPSLTVAWAYKKMNAGITPSEMTAQRWQEMGVRSDRLHVVPNWIDFDRFQPATNKKASRLAIGLEESGPMILFVGRLVRDKGIELLMHAFSKILPQYPNATLCVVGWVDDYYQDEFERFVSEFGPAIERMQFVGESDKPETYYAAADVVVVPSLDDEPFGLVAVEAMACGTLTLFSSASSRTAVMGEENSDLVFAPGNVEALAGQLRDWLGRPDEARKRGLQLRERAMKLFGAAGKIEAYERVLCAAAGK